MGSAPAAGVEEIDCKQAWARLSTDPSAMLIDVRTRAEWSFVGVPDLSSMSSQPVFIEWQSFPDGSVNNSFAEDLSELLGDRGASLTRELLFICRSGVRSRSAAQAMAELGYIRCSNLTDGFEGTLDHEGHRGRQVGWKASGLPWVQS